MQVVDLNDLLAASVSLLHCLHSHLHLVSTPSSVECVASEPHAVAAVANTMHLHVLLLGSASAESWNKSNVIRLSMIRAASVPRSCRRCMHGSTSAAMATIANLHW